MGALAIAPMPWIVATSYGSEGVLRVYYFALPFLAFYVASTVYPTSWSGKSLATAIGTGLF